MKIYRKVGSLNIVNYEDAEGYGRPVYEIEVDEAEPIRHGHWEDKYKDGDWHCSVCGAIVEKDEQKRHNWYWCYHCGAKMDEVTE